MVDIGGGVTEFVLGGGLPARHPAARTGINALSVDIGCVRMTERHLHSDPPGDAEIAAAAADIDAALDMVAAAMPAADAWTPVGLAGSVTTLAGLALRLPGLLLQPDSPQPASAQWTSASKPARLLRPDPRTARRAGRHAPRPGGRHRGWGAALDRVMRRFGLAEALVSEHDILDGIAWALTAGR